MDALPTRGETVRVITRLSTAKAGAVCMQELVRLHWSIENGLHYCLDVSVGEDKCRVRHPVAATVSGLFRRVTKAPAGPGPNVSASLETAPVPPSKPR